MAERVSVSVVVASHARKLRLLWLLNALEEQTLAEPWELILVHTYRPEIIEDVVSSHPLARRGVLRQTAVDASSGSPALQRNLGWRQALGELIAFVDDDCRPEPVWLERLVETERRHPGAIVQGTTSPDPLEMAITRAPHVRTMTIQPVGPYAQTCNILYPRELLHRLDGFDERAIAGEDVGLSLRARATGRAIEAAPDAVVYHAVESHTLPGIVKLNLKWRHLAYLVKRHPEFREQLELRLFWDRDHLYTCGALLGLAGARRHPLLASLAIPHFVRSLGRRGTGLANRTVSAFEAPGQLVRQAAEVLGLAAGSIRHQTFVL